MDFAVAIAITWAIRTVVGSQGRRLAQANAVAARGLATADKPWTGWRLARDLVNAWDRWHYEPALWPRLGPADPQNAARVYCARAQANAWALADSAMLIHRRLGPPALDGPPSPALPAFRAHWTDHFTVQPPEGQALRCRAFNTALINNRRPL